MVQVASHAWINFLNGITETMGMDVGGPSSAQLGSQAGNQGAPPDTGRAFGAALNDVALNARQRYAAPTEPMTNTDGLPPPGVNAPEYYNYQAGLPVKYDVPTAAKERFQARAAIRQAAAREPGLGTAVQRTDPITDEEVNYLQSMQDQAELADFDMYVNSLIDPRKPGNLKWLMEIYPDYVNRRIQQVHTDYEFALRNQMIDSWGINTFDDLQFKYMVDQGKIDGPFMQRPQGAFRDAYAPGLLSPWSFMNAGDQRDSEGSLKLPFASARYGRRPMEFTAGGVPRELDRENWAMPGNWHPLANERGTQAMANSMYDPTTTREDRHNRMIDRIRAGGINAAP